MGSNAIDRDAVLRREDEAGGVLAEAFEAVPAERRSIEGVVPGWSTQDMIFHCAFWADDAGDVLERMRAGDAEPKGFDGPEGKNPGGRPRIDLGSGPPASGRCSSEGARRPDGVR